MSETTTDTIREYHALVEFGEPGSVEKFVTDLVAELEALRARLRTTEQERDNAATRALIFDGERQELRAALAQREQENVEIHNICGHLEEANMRLSQELAALATRLAQLEQEPSLMPPGPDRSNPRHREI